MRIFCFFLIILLAYIAPYWLVLCAAFAFALYFHGPFELMLPALLIDAQFGLGGSLGGFSYTLGIGAALLIAEIVKPYLRFHTTLV